MALSTLANVIQTAAPGANNAAQVALKHFLRRSVALIRGKTRRFHGGVIEQNTAAAASVILSYGHGLESGDVILISGSNSTPVINGLRTVTVLNQDEFTIPVAVTSAGSAGYYAKQFTEFYDGNGQVELQLRQVPVLSVTSVWLDGNGHYGQADGAFGDSTLLTVAQDYDLVLTEAGYSPTGILRKLGGVWPGGVGRSGMASFHIPGNGNIKAKYLHGYRSMPAELSLAAELVATDLYKTADSGAAMAGESIDYYSYTRMTPENEEKALASAKALLSRYTTRLV